MIHKKTALIAGLVVILSLGMTWPAAAEFIEHTADDFFRLVDERERLLWETGRTLTEGEQLLTGDNRLFEIVEIEGRVAHAELIEEIRLPETPPGELLQMYSELTGTELQIFGPDRGVIGIYFTHNAESYVPSDGTESVEGRGGIHQVGAAFGQALENRGIEPLISDDLHLPHDRGAYRRSRDTVQELLAQDPEAVFDIHRDAAPAEQYEAEVDGRQVAQIMITVGQQNPNFDVNREYALSLKNAADQVHEGLVRGIFFGSGDYNQDLSPMNLLLEVGGHLNRREDAEEGITLFADVVDFYLFAEGRAGEGPPGGQRTALITALELVGLAAVVGFGFLVISTGSFAEAKERILSWFRRLR